MTSSFIYEIATFPAELIVNFVMMLFGMDIYYLGYGWRVLIVGLIAFVFWLHVLKFLFKALKRKFGIYE